MGKSKASAVSSKGTSLPSDIVDIGQDDVPKTTTNPPANSKIASPCLGSDFYEQSVHQLARSLLGKILVRELDDGTQLRGRIAETEAYPGSTDQASHTFRGKTERNSAMFDSAGTAYVYFIYGMYHCLNVSALEPGAGVLIRAIQPTGGIEAIRTFRTGGTGMKSSQLCNGPGRLCQAFSITTQVFNKHDLRTGQRLWLENDSVPGIITTVVTKRIGINPRSFGDESVQRPWRYYILGCPDVSKRDRISEAQLPAAAGVVPASLICDSSLGKARKSDRRTTRDGKTSPYFDCLLNSAH